MKEIMRENACGMKFVRKVEPKNGIARYVVLCPHCGKEVIMYANKYYLGQTSCKCRVIHSSNNRLYSIWINMKTRCYNENSPTYKNYGGRGIKVCDEWLHDFYKFNEWAVTNGYAENLTIDRIDNDKDYSPENCRWADYYVQANNKRSNVKVTINGVTKTLKQWCKDYNLCYKTEMSFYYRHGIKASTDRLKDLI